MIAERPDFDHPPLVEQGITVTFDQLPDFSIGDFGLFWTQIQDEFPRTEVKEPLDQKVEEFDGSFKVPQFEVRLIQAGVMQRCFYWSETGNELIQVQSDRFTFNWRGVSGESYPRSKATKSRFDRFFALFQEFVSRRGLGEIKVRQWELSNINIVPVSDCGGTFADAPRLFRVEPSGADARALPVESYSYNVQHLIVVDDAPCGRLYTSLSPVIRVEDGQQAYRLEIMARGALGPEGGPKFFDNARGSINAAFLAITTPEAHALWGLKDG